MPLLLPLAQAQPKGLPEIIDNLARTPLSQVVLFVAVLTAIRVILAPKLAKTPIHLRDATYRALRLTNELLDAIIYAGVFVFLIIRPFGVQAFRIPSGSMWPTLYVNDFVVANKAIYRYSDPKVGDVVVFRPPAEAIQDKAEGLDSDGQVKQDFIKRCIGTPNDVIEVRDNVLFRNGKQAVDPTRNFSDTADGGQTFTSRAPDTVPKASFKFVNYKGRLIPFNYTSFEGNALGGAQDRSYAISDAYAIPPEDFRALADQKAQPIPAGYYLMMGDNRNNSFDGRGWGLVKRDRIIGRSEFIWLPFSRMGRTPSVKVD